MRLIALNCDATSSTRHDGRYCIADVPAQFQAANANNVTNGISMTELTNWVVSRESSAIAADQELGNQLIMRLTGVPDPEAAVGLLSGIGQVSSSQSAAEAVVTVSFTLGVAPDTLFPGEKDMLLMNCIKLLYPNETPTRYQEIFTDTVMTILSGDASGRRLSVATSSTVTITAYFPSDAAASAGSANMQSVMSSPAAATTYLGVPVTSTPTVSISKPPGSGAMEIVPAAIIAGLMVVLFFVACCVAKFCSEKMRKKFETAPKAKGCCGSCRAGCCSAFALKGWAWNNMIAIVFLLVAAGVLFHRMHAVTMGIIGIIDAVFAMQTVSMEEVRDAVAGFSSILGMIDPIRPQLPLLTIAVIVPAAVAAIFLLISSLCSCRASGTMWCAKLFLMLTYIFLIICIVFYIIFAALGIAISLPIVRSQLSMVTGICGTTLPMLQQTLQDSSLALERARATPGVASADLDTAAQQMANAAEPAAIMNDLCGTLYSLFDHLPALFAPALSCVFAAIYGLYSSCVTCCVAKCCCSPKVTSKKYNGELVWHVHGKGKVTKVVPSETELVAP